MGTLIATENMYTFTFLFCLVAVFSYSTAQTSECGYGYELDKNSLKCFERITSSSKPTSFSEALKSCEHQSAVLPTVDNSSTSQLTYLTEDIPDIASFYLKRSQYGYWLGYRRLYNHIEVTFEDLNTGQKITYEQLERLGVSFEISQSDFASKNFSRLGFRDPKSQKHKGLWMGVNETNAKLFVVCRKESLPTWKVNETTAFSKPSGGFGQQVVKRICRHGNLLKEDKDCNGSSLLTTSSHSSVVAISNTGVSHSWQDWGNFSSCESCISLSLLSKCRCKPGEMTRSRVCYKMDPVTDKRTSVEDNDCLGVGSRKSKISCFDFTACYKASRKQEESFCSYSVVIGTQLIACFLLPFACIAFKLIRRCQRRAEEELLAEDQQRLTNGNGDVNETSV